MEGMPRRDLERPSRAVLGGPLADDVGLDLKAVVYLNYVLIDKAADELVIRIRRGERIHAVALIAVECENIVCRSGLAKLLACALTLDIIVLIVVGSAAGRERQQRQQCKQQRDIAFYP